MTDEIVLESSFAGRNADIPVVATYPAQIDQAKSPTTTSLNAKNNTKGGFIRV